MERAAAYMLTFSCRKRAEKNCSVTNTKASFPIRRFAKGAHTGMLFSSVLSVARFLTLPLFSYERAEAFYALNLPVRAHGLEESLNNFVKGEILEGDNAYFCEKCGQKVSHNKISYLVAFTDLLFF